MTAPFKIYGEIEIDGKKAQVEIKGVDDALQKAAGGADKFTFAGKGAAGASDDFGKKTNFAAGSVANMGAQLNDIGVMLAAGQSPLMLAVQQGTQINQVFGNAGVAQRMALLRSSITSIINPASLMTIGLIAGGAALVQWGISAVRAGEDVEDFAEKIEAAENRIKSLQTEVRTLELGVSSEELTLLDAIAASREKVRDLQAEVNAADVEGVIFADQKLAAEKENLETLEAQLAQLRGLSAEAERLAAVRDAEESAREELADLRAKAEITQLINRYGEDSRRVTVARVQAERDAFLQTKLSEGIAADLVVQLLQAWDAAKGVASVDMAGNITLAANEANRLMDNLLMASRIGLSADLADEDAAMSQNVIPTADDRAGQRNAVQNFIRLTTPPAVSGGGRRGGGVSGVDREREAVQDLISTLQEQLDVVRETDPVQKEMIRNRETLAAATDTEKQSVEQLIAARIAEEAEIEAATERAEAFKDAAYDALEGVILRSEDGADAVANLADALADAALQAALLGTGPLAGLFGTADGGGFLTAAAAALFPTVGPGKAGGGMIYGPGGPRDDKVLTPMSAGEFAVNAVATAQNRALLEYINGGGQVSSRGFADGGMPFPVAVPAAVSGGAGGGGRLVVDLRINDALLEARVSEVSQGITVEAFETFRADVLPGDIATISADPGRIG
jgi:hypothetical protein